PRILLADTRYGGLQGHTLDVETEQVADVDAARVGRFLQDGDGIDGLCVAKERIAADDHLALGQRVAIGERVLWRTATVAAIRPAPFTTTLLTFRGAARLLTVDGQQRRTNSGHVLRLHVQRGGECLLLVRLDVEEEDIGRVRRVGLHETGAQVLLDDEDTEEHAQRRGEGDDDGTRAIAWPEEPAQRLANRQPTHVP